MIATTRGRVMTRERWESIAESLRTYDTRVSRGLSGNLVAELRALGSAAFKYQAENRELNMQLDEAIKRAVAAEHEMGCARNRLSSVWGAIGQFIQRAQP